MNVFAYEVSLKILGALCTRRIEEIVGIKKQLARAEGEIVDSAQESTIIKDARAKPDYGLAGFEGIVRSRHAWAKVVMVRQDGFFFPAQTEAHHQVWFHTQFIVDEETKVSVLLRRAGFEVLPKPTGSVGKKISGAVKIESAGRVRQVDEGRLNPLHVAPYFERMPSGHVSENLLKLYAVLAPIGGISR